MTFHKLIAIALLLAGTAFSATAGMASETKSAAKPVALVIQKISHKDRALIGSVVERQVIALTKFDSEKAFALTGRETRAKFKSPWHFLATLFRAVKPVVLAKEYVMDGIETGRQIYQRVVITGPKKREWLARFLVQKQEDGSWLVNGLRVKLALGQRV